MNAEIHYLTNNIIKHIKHIIIINIIMRLTIENKSKQEVFVAIFQLLKNWSSYINIHFEENKLYIQSMDKSHICLADIIIQNKWFTNYECNNNAKISIDSNHFAILMNYALKHDIIELKFDDKTISFNDYLDYINNEFLNLIDPEKYQFALYVDIISTHDQIKKCKGWQNITTEQMVNFLNNSYKIDYL